MTTTIKLSHVPRRACRAAGQDVWEQAFVGLIFAALLFPVSYTVADPDLWGHIRFGQDIVASGHIAAVDPYSYTAGSQPWINHELVAEILFGWTYGMLGDAGLVLLKTLVIMTTLGLVYWYARRVQLDRLPAAGLTFLAAIAILPDAIMVRPHVFTYLFYALTLVILSEADRGRIGLLWLLPPLFALWINTHGGVLAGLGIAILWAFSRLGASMNGVLRWQALVTRQAWIIYAALGVSSAALLANPYGWTLVHFLVRTGTVPRPEITEWNAVRLLSFEGASYVALLVATTFAIAYSPYRRWSRVILLAVTAALPLLAQRHLPLFGLTCAILGVEFFAHAWRRWSEARAPTNQLEGRHVWIVWFAAVVLVAVSGNHFRNVLLDAQRFPMPVRAVALLHRSGVTGNLAVAFNWGEYVIWHTAPNVRVSVDGRRETVYSKRCYRQNLNFMCGTNRWDALLTDYPTNMALVERGSAAANLMIERSDWELVYRDRLCVLFVKCGTPQAAMLRRATIPRIAPDGRGLLFPGP